MALPQITFTMGSVNREAVAYLVASGTDDGHVTHEDKNRLKDLTKPKSRPPTEDERMAGDLNGDGKLNEKDLMLHKRMLGEP